MTLSDDERQQIIDLIKKINSLGIDLNGLVDYAESLYNSFKNGDGSSNSGIAAAVGGFLNRSFLLWEISLKSYFHNKYITKRGSVC